MGKKVTKYQGYWRLEERNWAEVAYLQGVRGAKKSGRLPGREGQQKLHLPLGLTPHCYSSPGAALPFLLFLSGGDLGQQN